MTRARKALEIRPPCLILKRASWRLLQNNLVPALRKQINEVDEGASRSIEDMHGNSHEKTDSDKSDLGTAPASGVFLQGGLRPDDRPGDRGDQFHQRCRNFLHHDRWRYAPVARV